VDIRKASGTGTGFSNEGRFLRQKKFRTNAEMNSQTVKERVCLDSRLREQSLREAVSRMKLSARGYMRVLKVARTIADLEELLTDCRSIILLRHFSIV
jgi:predicted ATPase with chaperone activity